MRLKDKNALITGSNRGIGLSILESFAKEGCNIIAHSRKESKSFLDYSKKIAKKNNINIEHIHFDLEEKDHISKEVRKLIKNKTPIDILVNSAGVIHGGLFQMTPIDEIRKVMDINLFGMLELTQLVSRYMMRNKNGSIINISSVAGIDLSPGNCAYGLSKAAVNAFSKTLSYELSPYGIRVNVVAPSLTDTQMAQSDEAKKERQMLLDSNEHFARMADPKEIAKTVTFLASDEASFINGEIIRIDGGNKF